MIGAGTDTTKTRPRQADWLPAYAKGVQLGADVSIKATGLGMISEDFTADGATIDNFVNVFGELKLHDNGYIYGPNLSYAAAHHKTELLTDSPRVTVTLQDTLIHGEARAWMCSDNRMTHYYGVHIKHFVLFSKLSVCRGTASNSVDLYEETAVTLAGGDEISVWYDRPNSTVRVYLNDAEVCAKHFAPTDIPHGRGNRYCGATMGANWLLDLGPNFEKFEARDVVAPLPEIYDPVDGPELNSHWVTVDTGAGVNRHVLHPNTIGPDHALHTDGAIKWDTQLSTDSRRIVANLVHLGYGKTTIVVTSNSGMTNWLGVQFEHSAPTNQKFHVVTGTGPYAYTVRSTGYWNHLVDGEMVFDITYDNALKRVRMSLGNVTPRRRFFDLHQLRWRSGNPEIVVQWTDTTTVTHGSGYRYAGLIFEASGLATGFEVSSFEVYPVTGEAPLP